ncbi:MAG: 3-deoxy-manno-octulosonate cytidylyltransferase [Shimia sp.]
MRTLLVIPARYASTRYPGKPLAKLRGAGGQARSLLERSWQAAMAVEGIAQVVIATDDARIEDAGAALGAEVVMTSPEARNGTERCAEAHAALGGGYDLVVNLQGDAPLTPAWFVESLVAAMRDDPDADIATPVLRMEGAALQGFLDDRRAGRVGGTTAVFGADWNGLYFSKEVIPYTGRSYAAEEATPVWHHVGVYAYRPYALAAYPAWPVGPLETLEGLEQLRFLEQGRRLRCVPVDGKGRAFWELNNPEDVPRIEAILAELGID